MNVLQSPMVHAGLDTRSTDSTAGDPGRAAPLAGTLVDTFAGLIDEVNRAQLEADHKIEEFATSPEKDIHGTMIALQKADISLRLLLQVRSKLTSAYQEVMRMQL